MKSKKLLCCAVVLFITFSSGHLAAQETDTAFIENYKKFRSFVDPLNTYNLYLVPEKAESRFLVNELEPSIKETYHFLRKKRTVKNEADFNVAVLIDQLVLSDMYSDLTEEQSFTGGITRFYNLVQPYRVSISLFVYAKGKTIEFPLCIEKKFKKEIKYAAQEIYPPPPEKVISRMVNGVMITTTEPVNLPPPPRIYIDSYTAAKNKAKISKNDLTDAFSQILREYKNYYVDRVD